MDLNLFHDIQQFIRDSFANYYDIVVSVIAQKLFKLWKVYFLLAFVVELLSRVINLILHFCCLIVNE